VCEWDDSDLLMTIGGWFAVGIIVGVMLGLLLAYWALVREQKEMVCPHCQRRMHPS
jgi:hypothetical protein